jgi:hypothetical protein
MAKSVKDLEKDINTLNAQIADLKKSLANAFDPNMIDKFSKSIEKLNATMEKAEAAHLKSIQKEDETLENLVYNLQKKAKAQEKILSKDKKTTEESSKLAGVIEQIKKLQSDNIHDTTENLQLVRKLTKELSRSVDSYQELEEIQKESTKSAEDFLNDVSKGIAKLPIIGESLSKGFDAFINSEYANKLKSKIAEKMFDPKALGKSFSGAIGLGLAAAGTGLVVAGINAGLNREQQLKDQQRSIGLTNKQSIAVDKMQRGLLNSSNNMVVSLEEAKKAYSELVDDFGVTAAAESEMVNQQNKLTKAYGLQAEEATNLQKAAMISGQSTEEMKIEILATAAGFNKVKGSSYSLSSVMKTVSKLSESIRLQFKGSGQELTNAVMKAKTLGTSLEDLNGIADNLLNIESSIEAQVTAQLVTGKNINMDKARTFALLDDMNGLMDELVKQEIDYNSYSKMNRVEKQSTAAALGMNIDQMAKFVSQQELSKKLNIDMSSTQNKTAVGLERSLKARQEEIHRMAELGDAAAQQYEKDNESLTNQEKMTAAVEQMSKLFTAMAPIIVGIGAALLVAAVIMTSIAIKTAMAAGAALTWSSAMTFGVGAAVAVAAAAAAYTLLPGAETGGEVVAGKGPVVVGENGPEIVHLKKGNMVTPNDQLTNLASNNKPAPAPVVNVSLVVGNTAINEIGNKISMNQNYRQGVGNSYNRLG